MMMKQILVSNVTKQYKNKLALNNVSLIFEKGKIYGLLGRNGAGKTSLINIIANRNFASSGDVLINGVSSRDQHENQAFIFAMSEADYYMRDSRVLEQFQWADEIYSNFDLKQALDYADAFEINTKSKLSSLSTGYYNIFKLIIALSVKTDFVIYDEPVVGLDANHRELFYKFLLKSYEKSESAIIIATHLIEEVSNIIEDIMIIEQGNVLIDEPVEDFLKKAYVIKGDEALVDDFVKEMQFISSENLGNYKQAYVMSDEVLEDDTLEITKPSLQKLFTEVTKKGVSL